MRLADLIASIRRYEENHCGDRPSAIGVTDLERRAICAEAFWTEDRPVESLKVVGIPLRITRAGGFLLIG